MDTDLQMEIAKSLVEGKLPCSAAFKIATKAETSPRTVGDKADELGIRIVGCQLGCFGVAKATHEELAGKPIDSRIAEAVNGAQKDGHIQCASVWQLADSIDVSRRWVGDTATQLKIKISDCQLGCF